MEARHPLNGKPIRILRFESQIGSDRKTLLWARSSFAKSERWRRWHCVVTEPEAVEIVGADALVAILLNTDANLDAWMDVLPSVLSNKSECLLLAPNSVIDALDARGFRWVHTLPIEELHDNYPYLGEPIRVADSSSEKIIIALAHLLRMNVVVWSSAVERDALDLGTRIMYDAWARALNGARLSQIPVDATDSVIPQTWLIQQYFHHPTQRRAREIRLCLKKNIECPWIDNILLLNEEEYSDLPVSPKLTSVVIGARLTYYDVFKAIQEKVPAGAFVIFANSDIWFNETLSYLWKISLAEKRLFLALLRWEDKGVGAGKEPYIFGPRADSQDTWILARDSMDFTPTQEEFGFPFGQSGCDNTITIVMLKHKFLVVNPAYSIKTMHLHNSNIRDYEPKDILYRPAFLYIDPTPIQSMKVCKDLSEVGKLPVDMNSMWNRTAFRKSFPRSILAVHDESAKVICTMLKHTADPDSDDLFNFQAGEQNMYTPTANSLPLYHFKGGTFINCQGLISSFNDIFVGAHKEWTSAWESARVSHMMPSIHVPSIISIPISDACKTTLSQWILHYLPKVLTIRRLLKSCNLAVPEFLVPQLRDITPFLRDCVWSSAEKGNITLVPMMDDMNYYSEDVWALPPSSDHSLVSAEDIMLLRELIEPVEEVPELPVAVFCVDDDHDAVCTREWAESVAEYIFSKGWIVRYVSDTDTAVVRRKAFAHASWIFGSAASSGLDYIWLAPAGAYVMEFNLEEKPRGDRIHLAGAAELNYVAGLIRREPITVRRQNALLAVSTAIKKFGFKDMLKIARDKTLAPNTKVPRILVPFGNALKGLWHHNGDTFREMVDIWDERGYVKIEKTEDTGYCWWGAIGEVLLYDRPTPRWWSSPPSYQMALFGNCAPPGPDSHRLRQSVWGFWARSPRAIETVCFEKKNLLGYGKRLIKSLFLGKIENGVQQKNRTKYDWSKCVELFSMPIDSTGSSYPYTQTEYLDKLCHARFGLCLPGFGPKCNREIEYFACGVVPIVTEGVDMTGYLVAPKEGVHYFKASTPADVSRIVKETSADTWTKMSLAGREWWQSYCSAEGLFRLTWTRIEQCRPFFNVGIPKLFPLH